MIWVLYGTIPSYHYASYTRWHYELRVKIVFYWYGIPDALVCIVNEKDL